MQKLAKRQEAEDDLSTEHVLEEEKQEQHLGAHYFDLSLVISSSCLACISGISIRSVTGFLIKTLILCKGVLFTVVLKDETSSQEFGICS